MAAIVQEQPEQDTRPRRRTGRVVAVALVVALVVAGLAAWLLTGLRPSITSGAISADDPQAVLDEDPLGTVSTSVVVDPDDGTWDGVWSIRNDGRATATVRVTDDKDPYTGIGFALFERRPDGGFLEGDRDRTVDSVTLAPGEQAGLAVTIGMGCAPYGPGTGLGVTTVDLDVTTLGLTRTVTVDGNVQVLVRTETGHRPGAECEEGS